MRCVCLGLFAAVCVLLPALCAALDPIVVTSNGYAAGQASSNGVLVFSNIGYAVPPVGANRFRASQAVASWSNSHYANATVPVMCPQQVQNWIVGQEDCLYLDIYTPVSATPHSQLPVYFFVYGGGFVSGDKSAGGLYNLTNRVAQHGYVAVIANYRVGVLGLMASDELRAESGDGSVGNMGLRDQRLALKWVQANIAAFGGNPNRVTLGGVSAGGWSVCFHLASPASKGLFSAALIQSASCDLQYSKYADMRNSSQAYAAIVGCTDAQYLQCMRSKSVNDLLAPMLTPGAPAFPWSIVIDFSNEGLFGTPYSSIMHGQWAEVNVLTGSDEDEGLFFLQTLPTIVPGLSSNFSDADVIILLKHFFNQNESLAQQGLALYPMRDFVDANDRFDKLFRDIMFTCPARRLTFAVTAQSQTAWLYHFAYTDALVPVAMHGNELTFVFDTLLPFAGNDFVVVNAIGDYWSNFIWTYDPNGNGAHSEKQGVSPYWPPSTADGLTNIKLVAPPVLESAFMAQKCQFWDQAVSLDFFNVSSSCSQQYNRQCLASANQCASNSLVNAPSTTSSTYSAMMCGCVQAQYACQYASGCYEHGVGLSALLDKVNNYCGANAAFTFDCSASAASNPKPTASSSSAAPATPLAFFLTAAVLTFSALFVSSSDEHGLIENALSVKM